MEFGVGNSEEAKENREKMAKASKRALDQGNDEIYNKSVWSITNGGGSKEDLADFNDEFEKLNSQPANNLANEGRNQIKVSESQLFNIIEESVKRIIEAISKTDMQEPYDGAKRFVPMSDRGIKARQLRNGISYLKNSQDNRKKNDLEMDYRKQARDMYVR
jgi:hypothetical protein